MHATKSWDFEAGLLYKLNAAGMTMRDQIMSIRSLVYLSDPLFHSVDQPSNGSSVVLLLHHPDDNDYAQQIKSGFIAYLRRRWRTQLKIQYEKGSPEENEFLTPLLYRYFTADTVMNAATMDWDEVNNCVISETAEALEAILAHDTKFKFKVLNLDMQAVLLAEASAKIKVEEAA